MMTTIVVSPFDVANYPEGGGHFWVCMQAHLPSGEGMFRFSTLEEAAVAFDAINNDYERQCRAAREIAAAYFDARQVLTRILSASLS